MAKQKAAGRSASADVVTPIRPNPNRELISGRHSPGLVLPKAQYPRRLVVIVDDGAEHVDRESYVFFDDRLADLTADELDRVANACRATATLMRLRGGVQ